MKFGIEIITADPENSAQSVMSKALGFKKELSHNAIINIFSETAIDGKFASKKKALFVADKINKRGAFGGFGKFRVLANVVEV